MVPTSAWMPVLFGVHVTALRLVEAVATAGWVGHAGARQLPWLWLGDLVITLLAGTLYFRIADRWSRTRLVAVLFSLTAIGFLACSLGLLSGWHTTVFYGLAYACSAQQLAVLPMALWTLATDLHPSETHPVLFPRIASGETLGQLLGYAVSASVGELWGATGRVDAGLLAGGALVCVAGIALSTRLPRVMPQLSMAPTMSPSGRPRPVSGVGRLRDTWETLRTDRPVRLVALIVVLCWVSMTVVAFHVAAKVEAYTIHDSARFRTVYATYYIGLMLVVFILQAMVGRMLQRVQLRSAFIVLPIVLCATCGFLLLATSIWTTLCCAASTYLAYDAWDSPARHAWVGTLRASRRGRFTALLDNQAYVVGSAAGALALGIGCFHAQTAAEDANTYLTLGLGAAIVALWAAVRLWRVDDSR